MDEDIFINNSPPNNSNTRQLYIQSKPKKPIKKIILILLAVLIIISYTIFHFSINVGDHYKAQKQFHSAVGDYNALTNVFVGEPRIVEEYAKFFSRFSHLEVQGLDEGWLFDYFNGSTVIEDKIWINPGPDPNNHLRSKLYKVTHTLVNNSGIYYQHTEIDNWKKTESVRYWAQKMVLDDYVGYYSFDYNKIPFTWIVSLFNPRNVVVTNSTIMALGFRRNNLEITTDPQNFPNGSKITLYELYTDELICTDNMNLTSRTYVNGREEFYFVANCQLSSSIVSRGILATRFIIEHESDSVYGYALLYN